MTYSLCIAIEAFLEFLSPKIAKQLTAAEKDFTILILMNLSFWQKLHIGIHSKQQNMKQEKYFAMIFRCLYSISMIF